MNSSTFHKFAIIWLALWFGVIVPSHKRGVVLLPGGGSPPASTAQAGEPCPLAQIMAASGKCCPSSGSSNSSTPGVPVTHCAVCYLSGILDVPTAPDLAPKPIELLEILPWPKPVAIASAPTAHIYFGRAPPPASYA